MVSSSTALPQTQDVYPVPGRRGPTSSTWQLCDWRSRRFSREKRREDACAQASDDGYGHVKVTSTGMMHRGILCWGKRVVPSVVGHGRCSERGVTRKVGRVWGWPLPNRYITVTSLHITRLLATSNLFHGRTMLYTSSIRLSPFAQLVC